MTTERPAPSPESSQLDALEARVRKLRESVAQQQKNAAKKRTKYLACGGVLTLVSCISLGAMTSKIATLDAHAVTQIGRQHFEKHLPAGRASLATYLTSQAPAAVRHTLRTLVDDLLPELRARLVDHLDKRLRRILAEGEATLAADMENVIATAKTRLEARYPDLSEKERLEKLVATVAESFRKNTITLLDVVYPQYKAEITRLERFVKGLASSDDELLTPKERTQKELIRTLLRLIALEHSEAQATKE